MKKYDIKTTDAESLKKWYYLMTIYCNLWDGPIMPLMPGMMAYNWLWDKSSPEEKISCSLITGIC